MFVARHTSGKLVNLVEDKGELLAGDFTCPACQSPVQLKQGKVMRPHFAHVSLKECRGFAENESAQHLQLKSQLYQWLKKTEEVALEESIPAIQQVADLLVNGQLALEVQCSRLSIARLKERTQSYRQSGYQVLWLLGKDLWLGQSLSPLQRQFLSFSAYAGFYLWELDSEREELRLRYLIHEDIRGRVQCLTRRFAFGQGSLLAILRLPYQSQLLTSFEGQVLLDVKRYIAQQLFYQSPKWMKQQEKAYLSGDNLLERPSAAFYPQICLPHSSQGFAQIERDLTSYYEAFEAFYQGQSDKGHQTLYAPAFYRQALQKAVQ